MAGTNIMQGDGLMIAVALGDFTQWGQLMVGYVHSVFIYCSLLFFFFIFYLLLVRWLIIAY